MTIVTAVKTNPNPTPESRSVAGEAAATTASAQSTTRAGTVFSVTPGLPQLFQSNFDYQLARGMLAGAYGDGGAVGESYSTARRIRDKDIESWTVEWTATASRIEAIATKCLRYRDYSGRVRAAPLHTFSGATGGCVGVRQRRSPWTCPVREPLPRYHDCADEPEDVALHLHVDTYRFSHCHGKHESSAASARVIRYPRSGHA
jgi:hypothetical protein